MKRLWGIALVAALMPIALRAQQQATPEPNPVSTTVRNLLERQSKNLVAAAEEMPADKYGFHPTPPQMTFGHLVLHIAESNDFLCSRIGGIPAPPDAKLSETDSKDKLVQALKSSFDYCSTALAKVDDTRLGETVTIFGGRQVPRAAALIALTNDWADHYSMAAMYLRLSGLLPPTAKPRK